MPSRFYAHAFNSLDTGYLGSKSGSCVANSVDTYSRMKYGNEIAAKIIGYDLASRFIAAHAAVLITNDCVVIPSPYNYVQNAASRMTHHFVNKVNEWLTTVANKSVETDLVNVRLLTPPTTGNCYRRIVND